MLNNKLTLSKLKKIAIKKNLIGSGCYSKCYKINNRRVLKVFIDLEDLMHVLGNSLLLAQEKVDIPLIYEYGTLYSKDLKTAYHYVIIEKLYMYKSYEAAKLEDSIYLQLRSKGFIFCDLHSENYGYRRGKKNKPIILDLGDPSLKRA